ncbi:hypothetical protein BH11BAC7_BH11BAC7_24760 [soil metagenome]
MREILFNLDLTHWQAALLAFLPALLNLFILIYVSARFPSDRISKIFSFYLAAMIIYQFGDTFTRLSCSLETAMLWSCIFMVGILFMVPIGLHFTLLFTGSKKVVESLAGQIFLYLPVPVFLVYTLLNKENMRFSDLPFWGWTSKGGGTSFLIFEGYWLGAQGVLVLILLVRHAFRTYGKSTQKKQALVIAIGYVIPAITAMVTQVIFPGMKNVAPIPLTSTVLILFSVGILVALKKFDLFIVTDALQTETILETMTDVVIIASPENEILFINKEGEEVLGLSNDSKKRRLIQSLFAHEKEYEEFREKLFSPALEGQKTHNFVTKLISKSGSKISVLISATPFSVSIGKPQVLLLVHNISEHLQTSEQLVLREEQLKEKTDELNTFFYRTTHDLKGPVASIIGLTKLATKDSSPETTGMCIQKIEQSASRLNNILLDLIKIMQIKERQTEVVFIDFNKMADAIIQSIKYSTGQDIVDFKVWVEPNIVFHSDEKLIDTILYNLVANAVNYRQQHDKAASFVHIQIRNSGDSVLITVTDNGIGIRKEIQDKIFNLFFRGTEDSKGTGLGLYILKNAVNKLNGRVVIDSEIHKGSTFTVYLPDLKGTVATPNTAGENASYLPSIKSLTFHGVR